MGECLIVRRGGSIYKLPVLDENYPADEAVTIVAGNTGTAAFSVLIAEAGTPAEYTYQWYVNSTAIEGATNSSYTRTVSSATTDEIYCEVRSKAGVVTSRVAMLSVTMHDVPILNTNYPADVVGAEVGGSATFTTNIIQHGNPAEYTYQWYVNGSAVSGATSSSYTKSNLALGSYTVCCKVTNSAGTVQSRTASLTVTKQYLYNVGNTYSSITGGWSASTYNLSGEKTAPTLTLGESTMTIAFRSYTAGAVNSENVYYNGSVWTGNTVDFSAMSTLTVEVDSVSNVSDGYFQLHLVSAKKSGFSSVSVASKNISTTGTHSLDVSSLSGSYYVVFVNNNSKSSMNVVISQILTNG